MEAKRIVFTKIGSAEILEEEIGEVSKNQVLVKNMVSTISSGTERANISGDLNVSVFTEYTEAIFPRYGGYSSAGEVVAVGDNVTYVKPGDRVAVSNGVHANYNIVDVKDVYKIPDEKVTYNDAALSFISCFSMAAIRKCRLEIGESAIIMGFGVLGMLALELLKAAGAVPIIVADPSEKKRKRALELGADFALNPFDADFSEQVKKITDGGVNVAIEVTGNGKALDNVLDCMARLGRVALLGCTRNSDFAIDYYHKVHGPGITLVGAHTSARPLNESAFSLWTDRDDINAFLKLIQMGRIKPSNIIDEIHSPLKAPEIYTRLMTEKEFPVVQFDWSKL
ncbi:MAG: zinc-binding alcohol dehydrogenase [Clostridia bacterium]|nr:zinc-binding alcohol dehydrogenase [Clostridia bacterium]